MLNDFKEKIELLKRYDFGAEQEIAVAENADKIPPLVRQQLEVGKDGSGEPSKIFDRTEYSPRTIEIKKSEGVGLGAVTDFVTNYMTGAFYESLQAQVEGNVFELDSDVPYFGDIRLYSSPELLEVNLQHRQQFAEEYTMPAIKESFKLKTGFTIT